MRHFCLVIVAILCEAAVCGLANPILKSGVEVNYPLASSENANNVLEPVALPEIPEFVKNGFDAGKKFLQSITNNDFVQTVQNGAKWFVPLVQSIGFFANVFVGFIESESKDLKFIKEQFLQVNLKMDTMEQEFHEIKKMIDWNTIKVSFGEYERSINSLQEMLVSMTEAENDVAEVMRDQFIMLYERTSFDAASKLYEGIINTQSLYNENLIVAVRKYTGNHRRKVQKFLLGVLQLVVKGLEVELMYMTYRKYANTIPYWQQQWESRLDRISQAYKEADDEIVEAFSTQIDSDLEEFNSEFHGLSNAEYSRQLYNYLKDKFPYRDFIVLVYNPVLGTDQHDIIHCKGHLQFRTRNHNIVVVSVDSNQQQTFDQATAHQHLASVSNQNDYSPSWLVDQMDKLMHVDCEKYSMVAAIKLNAELSYVGKASRIAYRRFIHYWYTDFNSRVNMLVFG